MVDECHRGSAAEDSAWREILEYFSSATQIGLTATPKETRYVSNIHYFGEPVYSYSLKQGILDGFLAPYKVIKVHIDRDVEGYRPEQGQLDRDGNEVEDRLYNLKDFDRTLVLDERTKLVARKVTRYLKESGDRFQKTIVFCVDQEHAARMRQALVNENSDLVDRNHRYVMRITGSDTEGQAQLDNFIDPESRYPVLVTTSRLLSTGVDVQTCRLIVLDREVGSMTEFKQILGRGTRVHEDTGKLYFTLMDFWGEPPTISPTQIYKPGEDDPVTPPGEDVTPPQPYGGKARAVLDALLAKYADEDVFNIDDVTVLRIPPFTELGTPVQLLKAFGGREGFVEDAYNYMKSGQLMRQVVNKIKDIDFNNLTARQHFGDIYEQILNDLQSAGNAGEYYPPRAVTAFMADRIDPNPGGTLFEPACGTGGFLTCSLRHMRKRFVKRPEDEHTMQVAQCAVEKKQLPHMLCVTNMLPHGTEDPSFVRHDQPTGTIDENMPCTPPSLPRRPS